MKPGMFRNYKKADMAGRQLLVWSVVARDKVGY